jgi:hypothetical protein
MIETTRALGGYSGDILHRTHPPPRSSVIRLATACAALYGAFLAYMSVGLEFSMFRSDVALYWRDSLTLSTPYSTWWVPLYPALIALVRTITLGMLPPVATMSLISAASYVIAVVTVHALAVQLRFPHPARVAGLFAVWPVVGLTYSVWPIADVTATALFLLCLLAFEQRRWGAFTVFAAAALMTHKSMWFFVPVLTAVAVIQHKESRRLAPLAFVPLLVWMGAGALHHGDPLWFVRWGAKTLVRSRGPLPILDGLFGPLLTARPNAILKGILILATTGAAVVTAVTSARRAQWGAAAVALGLMLLAISMNQYQIWVVARFSRLLIIPVVCALMFSPRGRATLENKTAYAVAMTVCVATNVAFTYYVVRVFFV